MKTMHGIKVYENLTEIVDPVHTGLVVWDVQNGLVDKIFNKEEFLASLGNLVGKLRGKMPVIYTLITPPPKEFSSSWRIYSMLRRFNVKHMDDLPAFMAPGSPEREIPAGLKPVKGDIVLEKASASIFVGTNFEFLMRDRGITTLLFTGIATEFGIDSSARDAANRGFYPVVVADCVSSYDKDAHEQSLKNLAKLVIVESSADILKTVK